mmetsp:Transcript_1825/g.3255  ORF Transcript_1825/g.3255 Transcript_1825/m.3255 type:complete len:215 (+) Transcript_1825:783-1427(+)
MIVYWIGRNNIDAHNFHPKLVGNLIGMSHRIRHALCIKHGIIRPMRAISPLYCRLWLSINGNDFGSLHVPLCGSSHMKGIGIIDRSNKSRERSNGLFENVASQFGNIGRHYTSAAIGHGFGRHGGGNTDILNTPHHGRIHQHDDIVRRCGSNTLQVIRLNLFCDKLFKTPLLMRQQMSLAPIQNHLETIVLRDCGIPFINSENGVGADFNHMFV